MTATDFLTGLADGQSLRCVCCHCHRVRNSDGEWEVQFVPQSEPVSHGICRDCFFEFYPKAAARRGAALAGQT